MDNVIPHIDSTSVYTRCVPHVSVNVAIKSENFERRDDACVGDLAGLSKNVLIDILFSLALLPFRSFPWNHCS